MGQIEKRKKKGRPSKADLAARRAAVDSAVGTVAEQQQLDLRRRSFRCIIVDYDDEVDERESEKEEEEDDEDERRREKKVKLVLKLNGKSKRNNRGTWVGRVDPESRASWRYRVEEVESELVEDEEDRREVKKTRINGGAEAYNDDENGENDEEEGVNGKSNRGGSVPGMPTDNTDSATPLPHKKQLVLILDKLQKKDTYGVYAEPVDPEELPDYHEIIEHPMDFSTVRRNLANGAYSTLEQFENDVFLISLNAMQYNAPETVYHKQACAIKELARKKFQRIRNLIERLEKEPKSETKCEPKCELKSDLRDRPDSHVKKQSKKPLCRSTHEPVGSDFSLGATLAKTDSHNKCSADHVVNLERPSNNDGLVEGILSLADNNIEKAEDPQSGNGVFPKSGKRSFVVDENRRVTYNLSNQPVDRCESIFTPFEDEKKLLIPVGLPGEYSYARSLARFAANLGSIEWRIASKRIEQVLPPGFQYGRGWVGEYEPLHNVVLVLGGKKEYPFASNSLDIANPGKTDKHLGYISPGKAHLLKQPSSDGKLAPIFASEGAKKSTPKLSVIQEQIPPSRGSGGAENMMVKRVESNCLSANDQKNTAVFQQQSRLPRDLVSPENMGTKRVEPNSPSISNEKIDHTACRQSPSGVEMGRKKMASSLGSVPMHLAGALASFPPRQDPGLSDPVLVMKMLTEKAQKQQNGSVLAPNPAQIRPSIPSPGGDGGSHAAAAGAWMSVGAVGLRPAAQNSAASRSHISADALYNGIQMFHPQTMQPRVEYPVSTMIHFQPEKKGFPFQALVPESVKVGNEHQVHNRPMVFPQMVTNDLSRFQVHSAWQGLSPHTQKKQKQDTLPPDLNVAFHSVDSQQPDLALQL